MEKLYVLITGCSSGIGLNAAQFLQNSKYHVITTARTIDEVKELKQNGFTAYLMDMSDSVSIKSAMLEILEFTDNKIYALFNNAGYGQPGAVEDLSRKVIRSQFETNVFGVLELTNIIVKVMRSQGYGRLIFNSSLLGIVAMPYRGAYNASKFALEGLFDTMRLELKDTNIKVSIIEPGPIESEFRKNSLVKFEENIDMENSSHKQKYKGMLERLANKNTTTPFTLPATSVTNKLMHALESSRPKAHYPVTVPAYLAFWLRRILPTYLLDKIAIIAGK